MAVKKLKKVAGTTSARRPRVKPHEEGESFNKSGKQIPSAKHKEPLTRGTAMIAEGGVQITAQLSELVPVAQYANVQVGPVQLTWLLGGIDMSVLADVENWGELDSDGDLVFDESTLTPDQLRVYKKVQGSIRATSRIIAQSVAEDRGLVDESIRLHNAREEKAEEAANKKSKPRRGR
jgi:hypothetical protein